MERHAVKPWLLLLSALLLGACRGENSVLLVLQGNTLFNRGEDVLATYSYLRAERELEDPGRLSTLAYDLGGVFLSVGESEAAVEELERSLTLPGADARLRFRAAFNLGIAYYDLEDYRMSAEMFARALTVDAASWDAKINLELALKSLRTERAPVSREQAAPQREDLEDLGAVLENVHAKEVPVWEKGLPGAEGVPDW
jgi:tetratricopeptide (TPR) repeat protein